MINVILTEEDLYKILGGIELKIKKRLNAEGDAVLYIKKFEAK